MRDIFNEFIKNNIFWFYSRSRRSNFLRSNFLLILFLHYRKHCALTKTFRFFFKFISAIKINAFFKKKPHSFLYKFSRDLFRNIRHFRDKLYNLRFITFIINNFLLKFNCYIWRNYIIKLYLLRFNDFKKSLSILYEIKIYKRFDRLFFEKLIVKN